MFNTPIDRLRKVQKYEIIKDDLNNNNFRQVTNPKSFKYDEYYDGIDPEM